MLCDGRPTTALLAVFAAGNWAVSPCNKFVYLLKSNALVTDVIAAEYVFVACDFASFVRYPPRPPSPFFICTFGERPNAVAARVQFYCFYVFRFVLRRSVELHVIYLCGTLLSCLRCVIYVTVWYYHVTLFVIIQPLRLKAIISTINLQGAVCHVVLPSLPPIICSNVIE